MDYNYYFLQFVYTQAKVKVYQESLELRFHPMLQRSRIVENNLAKLITQPWYSLLFFFMRVLIITLTCFFIMHTRYIATLNKQKDILSKILISISENGPI